MQTKSKYRITARITVREAEGYGSDDVVFVESEQLALADELDEVYAKVVTSVGIDAQQPLERLVEAIAANADEEGSE